MKKISLNLFKWLSRLDRLIERLSAGGLVVTVGALLLFSVSGIVMRWLNHPLVWIEPLVRHLVFLTAFLGGVIATGRKSHIAIDILSRYLQAFDNHKIQLRFNRFIFAISTLVSAWLAQTSYHFFLVELQYGKPVLFGLTSGHLVFIIPCGFVLMSYRFFMLFLSSISMFKQEERV